MIDEHLVAAEVTCRTVGSSDGFNDLSSSVEDRNTEAVSVTYYVPYRFCTITTNLPYFVD